jgi:hypothetical protein
VSEARLHVAFGTDQGGSGLAAQLAGRKVAVQMVSRHRSSGEPRMPPIPRWPPTRPRAAEWCTSALMPRTRSGRSGSRCCSGVLVAAERTGALMVVENLYGYGRAGAKPARPGRRRKGHESH